MVTVSVPGKVHLMGEHAVVYGKPALLAAINLRLRVSIEDLGKRTTNYGKKKNDYIEIVSNEPVEYIRHAVEEVKETYKLDVLPPLRITVTSDIPAGYHLGSSAAVAVGTVGALTYFLKKIWNPAAINQLAYEVEKKMHGNPSGGDNTTVTMGGFIWFRKELEFLKSIWQLPFKIPKNLNHFFLIDTGRPKETTGEMVAYVNAKCQMQNAKYKAFFDKNEEQTKRIAIAIKEGNEKELIGAIRIGERTLEGMGVVSKKVIPLIREIENTGGAIKILGGGGKTDGVGFLLAYQGKKEKILDVCQFFGYKLQEVSLGKEGIRLEK